MTTDAGLRGRNEGIRMMDYLKRFALCLGILTGLWLVFDIGLVVTVLYLMVIGGGLYLVISGAVEAGIRNARRNQCASQVCICGHLGSEHREKREGLPLQKAERRSNATQTVRPMCFTSEAKAE